MNGRLEPAGVVDGFTVDIGASGSFCPPHLSLPVTAYFFNLSDDNAPSPYLVSDILIVLAFYILSCFPIFFFQIISMFDSKWEYTENVPDPLFELFRKSNG